MSHDQLRFSPAPKARTAYDITYEVILVNNRVTKRLRGEDPGALPWNFGEEWLFAPDSFCDKDAVVAAYKSSMSEIIEQLGDDIYRLVPVGDSQRTAFDVTFHGAVHNDYHLAQLSYIQTILGDDSITE